MEREVEINRERRGKRESRVLMCVCVSAIFLFSDVLTTSFELDDSLMEDGHLSHFHLFPSPFVLLPPLSLSSH